MNNIEREPQKAISFEKKKAVDRLNAGQQFIVDLLNKHLKDGTPITREDITDVYIQANTVNGIKKKYVGGYHDGINWSYKYVPVVYDKTKWWVQSTAMGWFKSNLGSCIVKGKIIAIPVIEG